MSIMEGNLGWKGERGFSAYEIAVKNGFVGTEKDWLARLGTSSHFDRDIKTYTSEVVNQKEFTLPEAYTSNSFLDIYIEGERLGSDEYTLDIENKKIILTNELEVVGTKVEVVTLTMSTNNLPIIETLNGNVTNDEVLGAESLYNLLPVNVKSFGAVGDGKTDDTEAINQCILANQGKTITFSPGVYVISSAIKLPFDMQSKVSIEGNGATIKCISDMECVFDVGKTVRTESEVNLVGYTSYIKDLNIDCEDVNVNYAFDIETGFKDLKIINCRTYRTLNGVRIGNNNTTTPSDTMIENCLLYGKGSEYDSVGIISNCTDNNVLNTRIYGFRTGFEINGYITINQCHVLLRWAKQTTTNFNPIEVNSDEWNRVYPLTKFAKVNNLCKITCSYADSVYKYIEDYSEKGNYVTFTDNFYYNSRNNVDSMMFDFSSDYINYNISNNTFNISKNTKGIGINNQKTLNVYSQLKIENNLIQNITNLSNPGDLLKVNIFKYKTNTNIVANKWYVVGVLSNVSAYNKFILNVYLNGYLYKMRVELDANRNAVSIEQLLTNDEESKYTLGFIKDKTRDDVMYVCVKRSEGFQGLKFNVDIETSANLMFKVTASKESNPITDTALLSNYTSEEPITTLVLKSSIF